MYVCLCVKRTPPLASIYLANMYLFLRCRKLPRALKEWQAFEELRRTIDDFNETCPLLELMSNRAMMQRHWDKLEALTGHTFEVESDTFFLRNLMEAPLLPNKEDIEVWDLLSYYQYSEDIPLRFSHLLQNV